MSQKIHTIQTMDALARQAAAVRKRNKPETMKMKTEKQIKDSLAAIQTVMDNYEMSGVEIPSSLYARERVLRKELEGVKYISLIDVMEAVDKGDYSKAKNLMRRGGFDFPAVLAALREVRSEEPDFWDCHQLAVNLLR